MFVISVMHSYLRRVSLFTVGTFVSLFLLCNMLSSTCASEDDFLQERVKREAIELDPAEQFDYIHGHHFSRFSRRILSESESFAEENGEKIPIPIKSLNKQYYEVKRLYFAKKNCVPRPASTAAPSTAKPAESAGSPAAASDAEPAADTPAEPAADPPAEPAADPPADRRRRQAMTATTERVYYCDEFTTTAAPTPAPPAPADPAPGGDPAPPADPPAADPPADPAPETPAERK